MDGLRAVAASSVLVYHVWQASAPDERPMDLPVVQSIAPHLWHGVTLFFVLSGFLLFRPFAAAVIQDSPLPDVRRYFVNRGLRILPAYWVILIITALVLDVAVLRGADGDYFQGQIGAGDLLASALLVQNYSSDTLFTGIPAAWSLGVEVAWYLLLPVLALVAALTARRAQSARDRTRAVLVPVVLMIVLGMSGKLAALVLLDWPTGVERSLWSTADFFAYGMIVAVVSVELESGRLRLPSWWRRAAAAAFVGLVAAAVTFGITNLTAGGLRNYSYNVAMALACSVLLALVVLPDRRAGFDTPIVRLLDTRALTAVGVASYSLFLWHVPISFWLRRNELTADGWLGLAWNLLLIGAVSGALSALTYTLVERPALRRRLPWAGRPRPAAKPSPEQVRAAP